MSATVTISVEAHSAHDVLIQLIDTTPKPAGHIPIQSRVLRVLPGVSHELAVSPGISLCLIAAEPLKG